PIQFLHDPLIRTVRTFVNAAAASELAETGQERLEAARLQARLMPIDILDGLLAQVRPMVRDGVANSRMNAKDYGARDLEEKEANVRAKLFKAREYVVTNPEKLELLIEEIQAELEDIQVVATVLVNMETANTLIKTLKDHKSRLGSIWGKNADYQKKIDALDVWVGRWDTIYNNWILAKTYAGMAGPAPMEAVKTQLNDFTADPAWVGMYTDVLALITEKELIERFITIGVMIGIAVVTMGVGSYVSGLVGAGMVGGLLVAGAEALTFTLLSQIVANDTTALGLLKEFGLNLAMFTVTRALAAGFRGIVGAEFVKTGGGQVTEMVTFLIAQSIFDLNRMNTEKKEKTGKGMTNDEIRDYLVDNFVVTLATFLIGTAGKSRLAKLQVKGGKLRDSLERLRNHNNNTKLLADIAKSTKKVDDISVAIKSDQEALRVEGEILTILATDKKALKNSGLSEADIEAITGDVDARTQDREIAADMARLEPVGTNDYHYPEAEFDGFVTRQRKHGDVEVLPEHPMTKAQRVRITPKDDMGPAYTVSTRSESGGINDVRGRATKADESSVGGRHAAATPIYTRKLIELEGAANMRVGHSLDSPSEGLQVLRKLSQGDPDGFARLGLDAPSADFQPWTIEWGLGRLPGPDGKYIVIRGQRDAVDWGNYPGVIPIAHTHPFNTRTALKGTNREGSIPLKEILAGKKVNADNRVHVLPSGADYGVATRLGATDHHVATPYVAKQGPTGEVSLSNPGPDGGGERLQWKLSGLQQDGIMHGNPDIPVYKAKLQAEIDGRPVGDAQDSWGVHHPAAGSVVSLGHPPEGFMSMADAKAAGGTAMPGAKTPFKPQDDFDRHAVDVFNELGKQQTAYGGAYGDLHDFVAMYREGWHFNLDTRRWFKSGAKGDALRLPEKFTKPDEAYTILTGKDKPLDAYADMLLRYDVYKGGTEAKLKQLVRDASPAGKHEAVVAHDVKAATRNDVLDFCSDASKAYLEAQLKIKIGKAGGPNDIQAARHQLFIEMTKNLNGADKGNMAEQWVHGHYANDGAEVHVGVTKENNKHLNLETEERRSIDLVNPEENAGDPMVIDNVAIEVKTINHPLSPREQSQARDMVKMVLSKKLLKTSMGQISIDKVRYMFTTAEGARKNINFIREHLQEPALQGRFELDVFDARGNRQRITDIADLKKPELAWLTKK
ncbi:MAG: hypothetical protein H0T46_17950, partial [Deltaproteobacteria bacterium]|nr:hypothetical protein [Deltaproteobacteria bacterium]